MGIVERSVKRELSKNLYADYKPFTMVDGEGFRCSLYVSGCIFNCKGCYNKSIQDFNVGKPFTKEIEDQIMSDLSEPYVQGLTLLGGEPFLNPDTCLKLVRRLRKTFGNTKDIWCWTGYTYEELQESTTFKFPISKKQKELLDTVDVLIDGRFVEELFDPNNLCRFRGSSNQRIIDMVETRKRGSIVMWEEEIN